MFVIVLQFFTVFVETRSKSHIFRRNVDRILLELTNVVNDAVHSRYLLDVSVFPGISRFLNENLK